MFLFEPIHWLADPKKCSFVLLKNQRFLDQSFPKNSLFNSGNKITRCTGLLAGAASRRLRRYAPVSVSILADTSVMSP